MLSWIRYLLQPLAYLKIRYGEGTKSKLFLDVFAPLILTVILYLLSFLINKDLPEITTEIIDEILKFLTFAFPFYVASLTAVSTFSSKSLEKVFGSKEKDQATLKSWSNDNQRWEKEPLTRRKYTSYMFGYLSVVTLILIFILVFDKFFKISNFQTFLPSEVIPWMINTVNFLFWAVILNIVFVTLMALKFLISSVAEGHEKDTTS